MTIILNHTIVPARDKVAAARWFASIFGLNFNEQESEHFAPVRVNETLKVEDVPLTKGSYFEYPRAGWQFPAASVLGPYRSATGRWFGGDMGERYIAGALQPATTTSSRRNDLRESYFQLLLTHFVQELCLGRSAGTSYAPCPVKGGQPWEP
jgi:hypothetical protein